MLRSLALIASAFLFIQLAGCGGGEDTSGSTASAKPGTTSISAPYTFLASDYHPVVQQLYVAYFGRPADPGGLANFAAELSATDAPYDIQAFNVAYNRDARIRSLIDSFGISEESRTLYSGDTRTFIDAIYRNVLNRAPDTEGMDFWVNAIDRGGLTRANASFSIMAGALANVTPQGRRDAALIDRRIAAATRFTSSLSTPALANSYQGNAAAAIARSMLSKIVDTSNAGEIESGINTTLAALTAQQGATPDVFTATVLSAPPEGAVIRGGERIELQGSGIRNVELLPAAEDLPIYSSFTIGSDFRSASLVLDPQKLPSGPVSFRVVAWNVTPGGSGQSIVVMTRTWTIQNDAPPPAFSATLTMAPSDGATLTGEYTLEVRGSGLGNVELLPDTDYSPVLGRFDLFSGNTIARMKFDTRTLPNSLLRVRIVAFDVKPEGVGAREILVMPARSWLLQNPSQTGNP